MNFINYFISLCIISLFLFSFGCNDKPDPVGVSVLNTKDLNTVHTDTILATKHNSTKFLLNTKYVDRFMLGIDNSNGWVYRAISCIRFSDWSDTLSDITIDSAFIRIKYIYTSKSPASPLTFSVYFASQNWFGDSLSYDSLKTPSLYYSTKLNTINSESSDSILNINIIDVNLIQSWFVSKSDSNKGLILIPDESGNTGVIKGFTSFNSTDTSALPTLIIKYRKNGYSGSYSHSVGDSRYVSDLNSGTTQFSTDSMIYIQNGIAYHANVWFDNFTIPPQSSIYRATLEMTLDASTPRNYLSETLYASRTTTDGLIDLDYIVYEGTPTSVNTNKKLYKFEIANIVNAWKNGSTIPKLIIYGKNQSLSFDLFKLFGSGSLDKPRIIITYFSKK